MLFFPYNDVIIVVSFVSRPGKIYISLPSFEPNIFRKQIMEYVFGNTFEGAFRMKIYIDVNPYLTLRIRITHLICFYW